MKFEWDDEKETVNIAKHGIDFSTAALVFGDNNRIERYGTKHSVDEDRYITIGQIGGVAIVVMVVYTERKEAIRIISARVATKKRRFITMQKSIDVSMKPTKEQLRMLESASKIEIPEDTEYPEFTDDELMQFKRISEQRKNERQKQPLTLRLSPQAISKAKSLGKGYTSVLSRILENALENPEIIKRYL